MDPPTSFQPSGVQEEQIVEYQDPVSQALDHIMSSMDSRSGSLPASPSRPEGRPQEEAVPRDRHETTRDTQRDFDPAGPLGARVRHAGGDPRDHPATDWRGQAAAQASALGGGIGPALAKAGAQAPSYQPYSTWGSPFAGVPPTAGAAPSGRMQTAPTPAPGAGEVAELRAEMARMQEQLSRQHQDQLTALHNRHQQDYEQLLRAISEREPLPSKLVN